MKKKIIGGISLLLMVVVMATSLFMLTRKNEKRNYGKLYEDPNVEQVVIYLDPFPGWYNLFYANGGLETTQGSINAQNGIRVKYVLENNAETSADKIISGEANGMGVTINRLSYLNNRFEDNGVKVIMPFVTNYSNGGDGVICTKDINYIEDLVGKKIAVPKYSEGHLLVEWLLKSFNLTEEQINQIHKDMVYCNDGEETAELFARGEVDAAATWEPTMTNIISSMEARVLFDTTLSTELIMGGLVFEDEFAKTHEDFLVKLIDGAIEAKPYYMSDIELLSQMDAFASMSDEEIFESGQFTQTTTWADNISLLGGTCQKVYKEMANLWISIGEKSDPSKAESIFTDKYVKMLDGKYPKDEVTSFKFSEEGRKAAENLSENATLLKMKLNIEFESDSAIITEKSKKDLVEFAEAAKLLNNAYIRIEGNTAKVEGTDGEEFSLKRANNVKKQLQLMGIDPKRMNTIGNGDTKPVASNNTEEGRAKNRRTEVTFYTIGF